MIFLKRIFLFLSINFLVLTTVSILFAVFNLRPYISQYGINYVELLIFCLVWGMGGAFLSLGLSRIMAKWMLRVKVVDPKKADENEKALFEMVRVLAKKAKLPCTPQVGIYQSAEVNAFATGPTKKRSLVAVSSGLLDKMDRDQVDAILAHEITHIANGDMVTMTLIQGIINAFVMFLARVLALILSGRGRGGGQRGSFGTYYLFVILFQVVFMALGSMVVLAFSRWREYRADAGGAKLAGKANMIAALEGLKSYAGKRVPTAQQPALETMKISSPPKKTLTRLFLSHPPIDMRIARLKGKS